MRCGGKKHDSRPSFLSIDTPRCLFRYSLPFCDCGFDARIRRFPQIREVARNVNACEIAQSVFLPVSIALLILLVAGLYNLVWLPSQHKYLDNRNFRLLSTLNEQIRISIDTFDMMLDNAVDSGVPGNDTDNDDDTDTNLSFYLKQVAPRLKSVDKEEQKVLGDDFGDPPYIAVKADEGTHFLYLAFKRTQDTTPRKYAVRTDLDQLIRDLLPPANRNPFDVLLVAQKDGAVIFQSSAPRMRAILVQERPGLSRSLVAFGSGSLTPFDTKLERGQRRYASDNPGLAKVGSIFDPRRPYQTFRASGTLSIVLESE
jgi:hypothetical protein